MTGASVNARAYGIEPRLRIDGKCPRALRSAAGRRWCADVVLDEVGAAADEPQAAVAITATANAHPVRTP